MRGYVTTRHLFTHASDIVREFGMKCWLRCMRRTLFASRAVTFLECIAP